MNISREYAQRLLKMSKKPPNNIEEVAVQIVFKYPCHDFILDVEELKELGLNARPTTLEEEEVVREFAKRSQRFNIIGTIEDVEQHLEVTKEAAPAKEIIETKKGRRGQNGNTV